MRLWALPLMIASVVLMTACALSWEPSDSSDTSAGGAFSGSGVRIAGTGAQGAGTSSQGASVGSGGSGADGKTSSTGSGGQGGFIDAGWRCPGQDSQGNPKDASV